MVISLYSFVVLAFDLQPLLQASVRGKELQGSHIVIDIIITFYAAWRNPDISTAVNKYDSVKLKGMSRCSRCSAETVQTYSCQHTSNEELCVNCYQEIHWLLNKF